MRVLVAEEDVFERELTRSVVESMSHHCFVAHDATSLREATRTARPDIVLLDRTMADADGLELCREIRRSNGRYVAVMLLTSNFTHDDQVLAFEAGADDYIAKPLNPGELRTRLGTAERLLRASSWSVEEELRTLAQEKATGELVIMTEELSGRVLLIDGDVVWVQRSWQPSDMASMLQGAITLEGAEITKILERAMNEGLSFVDLLATRSGRRPSEVHQLIERRLSVALAMLVELRPRNLFFTPVPSGDSGGLRFSVPELLAAAHTHRQPLPFSPELSSAVFGTQTIFRIASLFDESLIDERVRPRVSRLLGLTLCNLRLGEPVFRRGESADADFLRRALKLVSMPAGTERIEVVSLRTQTHAYAIRPISGDSLFCLAGHGGPAASMEHVLREVSASLQLILEQENVRRSRVPTMTRPIRPTLGGIDRASIPFAKIVE